MSRIRAPSTGFRCVDVRTEQGSAVRCERGTGGLYWAHEVDHAHILETAFGRNNRSGGQELQLAVLDAEALREARAHPDRRPDLIVRVAGFNARFGELSTVEQDELIARAEAAG